MPRAPVRWPTWVVVGTTAIGLMSTGLWPLPAAAANPTRRPVVPASSTDGSGGSDDSCGTANPCGIGWVPRPGITAGDVSAASRRPTPDQDESTESGVIGWLLDLLGLTGHHPPRSSSGTGATGRSEPASGLAGQVLPGRSPRVAAIGATAATAPGVAAPTGAQPSRSSRQPALPSTALPPPVSSPSPVPPVHRPLDQPMSIAPEPSRLPDAPGPALTGRSRPELAEQWASARQAARESSGGAATTAPATIGERGAGEAGVGVPSLSGAGMGNLLSAAVTMTSTAVTAVAGPTVGRRAHDMLTGVLRGLESALTSGPGPAIAADRADQGSVGKWSRADDQRSPKQPR